MKLITIVLLVSALTNFIICEIGVNNTKNPYNTSTNKNECNKVCPPEDKMACAFDAETRKHKLFANNCTMISYGRCYNIGKRAHFFLNYAKVLLKKYSQ